MRANLLAAGVRIIDGEGALDGPDRVIVGGTEDDDGLEVNADTIVIATGARPRELETAKPDGERILTWTQLYRMSELPEHLIVVGSGVTGAEFASAYRALGARVTLISSRERVLPGEDVDAALVLEEVFHHIGLEVLSKSRADRVDRLGDGVLVTLSDGRTVEGSHCLMAVGSIPNTQGIGLEEAGVALSDSGHIQVNRVAHTSAHGIYAAGDCSDFLPLASVASMQGRTAVYHAMGDIVQPTELRNVTSNIFTNPEIATVGWQQPQVEDGTVRGVIFKLPPRAEPAREDARHRARLRETVRDHDDPADPRRRRRRPEGLGAHLPISIAVEHRLTVDELARAFSVYPSLSGSITDAARAMHIVH